MLNESSFVVTKSLWFLSNSKLSDSLINLRDLNEVMVVIRLMIILAIVIVMNVNFINNHNQKMKMMMTIIMAIMNVMVIMLEHGKEYGMKTEEAKLSTFELGDLSIVWVAFFVNAATRNILQSYVLLGFLFTVMVHDIQVKKCHDTKGTCSLL